MCVCVCGYRRPLNQIIDTSVERANHLTDYEVPPLYVTVVHGGSQWANAWEHGGNITKIADNLLNAEEFQQWRNSDMVVYPSAYSEL